MVISRKTILWNIKSFYENGFFEKKSFSSLHFFLLTWSEVGGKLEIENWMNEFSARNHSISQFPKGGGGGGGKVKYKQIRFHWERERKEFKKGNLVLYSPNPKTIPILSRYRHSLGERVEPNPHSKIQRETDYPVIRISRIHL